MTDDARFQDADEEPLRLTATDTDDLAVISALMQDGVGRMDRVQWMPRRRRFSILLYRFRWEDADRARREKRPFERVAAALIIDDVLGVRSSGIDRNDKEAVFNTLNLEFKPGEDGGGVLRLICSGGCVFEFDVESVNVALSDLTRPWAAGGLPQHLD